MRRRLGREIPDWRQGLPVGQMGTQTLRPVSHTCVLPLSKIKEQEVTAGGFAPSFCRSSHAPGQAGPRQDPASPRGLFVSWHKVRSLGHLEGRWHSRPAAETP